MPTDEPTVSVATAATRHDQFLAINATPQTAIDALLQAWRTRAAHLDLNPDDLRESDVNVATGPLGAAWINNKLYLIDRSPTSGKD